MPYFGGGSSSAGDRGILIGDANTEVDVFYIKSGDRLPVLRRVLADTDGTPIDLTGCTVAFSMGEPGISVKVSAAACTIVDAIGGEVEYPWAAADTNTVGTYRGEFKITETSSGKERRVPTRNWLRIKVVEEIA
jgi:hypothetical protein